MPLAATIVQPIPSDFVVVDPTSSTLSGSSLRWQAGVQPHETVELRCVLRWQGGYGEIGELPGAQLGFYDAGLDAFTTFTAESCKKRMRLPFDVELRLPDRLFVSYDNPVTLSIRNLDESPASATIWLILNPTTATEDIATTVSTFVNLAAKSETEVPLTMHPEVRLGWYILSAQQQCGNITETIYKDFVWLLDPRIVTSAWTLY
jgi:hypothetical protein